MAVTTAGTPTGGGTPRGRKAGGDLDVNILHDRDRIVDERHKHPRTTTKDTQEPDGAKRRGNA